MAIPANDIDGIKQLYIEELRQRPRFEFPIGKVRRRHIGHWLPRAMLEPLYAGERQLPRCDSSTGELSIPIMLII